MLSEMIWEQNGVYQRFSGQFTSGDRIQATNTVMGNPRFDSMKYWIMDSLAIEDYQLEKRDAVITAGYVLGSERNNKNVLMVFVATNIEHRDSIMRFMKLLEATGSTWKTRLFDDIEPARQWISETLMQSLSYTL